MTSFITNTDTSCDINGVAGTTPEDLGTNVNWTVIVPQGWSVQDQQHSLNYSQTATVPTHPDGGRPADMQIQVRATYDCNGTVVEQTVTATQSATDRIRQMYIDHNIKIPDRGEFGGGTTIAVKNEVVQGRNNVLTAYRNWCNNQTIGLWGRTSGYRNPEQNEDLSDNPNSPSAGTSLHQYGWAEDFGPITTDCGEAGTADDANFITGYLLNHGARFSYNFLGNSGQHYVHHDYRRYDELPNVVNP